MMHVTSDRTEHRTSREEVARLFRAWQEIEREYGWGSPQEMAARDAHGAASRKCAEHEELLASKERA